MSLKSYLKLPSVVRYADVPVLFSTLLSSISIFPPRHVISSLLVSSLLSFLLLSGQSSLCLLYCLSHSVKDLSGPPCDWPPRSCLG